MHLLCSGVSYMNVLFPSLSVPLVVLTLQLVRAAVELSRKNKELN
jgi:hypothetical protein